MGWKLAAAPLAACVVLAGVRDADACSCVGPQDRLWASERMEDAPLNTRVRFDATSVERAKGAELRVVPGGAKVEVTVRTWANGYATSAEIAPKSPLQPGTRYEIALVNPAEYPSTHVIGTFKTGTASDTTAPRIDAMNAPVAEANARAGGGDCSIRGPWIHVGGVKASDPGRPSAQIAYAVWLGDASGNVDTTKTPTTIVQSWRDEITIGKRSLCDPHDVTLPKGPQLTLAIAALDEAGNASAPRRFKVDMRGVQAVLGGTP